MFSSDLILFHIVNYFSNPTNQSTTKRTTSTTNNPLLIFTLKRPRNESPRDRTLAKFPDTQESTTRFCTRCPTLVSTVPMFRPHPVCTQMSRPAARPTTSATTVVRAIKAPRFSAPTERFSIRKSLHAIGGTTWIAARPKATISMKMDFFNVAF